VFVTSHGGGGAFVLNQKLPIFRLYTGAVAQSEISQMHLPNVLRNKSVQIKGGVDLDRFKPGDSPRRRRTVLFVGRILPHKGIDVLIQAFSIISRHDLELKIVGRPYHKRYLEQLQKMVAGLNVSFYYDLTDEDIVHEYQQALVTVLPSVVQDCYGKINELAELMGFTLLESQACGTPVICTDAGGMKEFVKEGETGFVVPQNSPDALAQKIDKIYSLTKDQSDFFLKKCRDAMNPYGWSHVARQHLELYRKYLAKA